MSGRATYYLASLAALACALGVACGSSSKKVTPSTMGGDVRPHPASPTRPPPDHSPPSVPSHLVADVPAKTIGPYFARRAGSAILAYIAPSEKGGTWRLVTVPLRTDGRSGGEARVAADIPSEPKKDVFVVRAAADPIAGFYAGYGALLDRGQVVSIVALNADGSPKGPAVDVARTNDNVVWMDLVATSKGEVCVWAEQTPDADESVFAIALDGDGKPRGLPSRVARGATGWQALAIPSGIALAIVTPVGASGGKVSALALQKLDADGRASGVPVTVASKVNISGQLFVARASDRLVFAWTDSSKDDPEAFVAALDDTGKIDAPHRAMESLGGASVRAVAVGHDVIAMAWEESHQQSSGASRLHFATLISGSDGLTAQDATIAEVRFGSSVPAAPELVAADAGFAVLVRAPVCSVSAAPTPRDAPCAATQDIAPTFLRLDARLAPLETQPLRLAAKHDEAALAWGLDCGIDRCVALGAQTEDPIPIRVVDLAPRASPYLAPVVPLLPATAPRVVALQTLAQDEPFTDVDAVRLGSGALLATLTGPSGTEGNSDVSATDGSALEVRPLDANGNLTGASVVVTRRALAVGGIAIAAGAKPEDGVAIAWVARERDTPQVRITRLDANGHRLNEVQLTGEKGGTSDVAIAWAGNGWVVAWVDARDGNGEVYATKIDTDLNRMAKEQRVTTAAGDAVDVTMLVQNDKVWIAWGDTREDPKDGLADIYVTSVRARDAKPSGDDVRVMATSSHSRSPSIALGPDGLMLAWIEEAPAGLDATNSSAYGAMLVKLDDQGHPARDPVHAPSGGDGRAIAIALEGDATHAVRGYLARASANEVVLDGFDATLADPYAYPLLTLEGVSLDVSIDVLGDAIFFSDHGRQQGERRLRRAKMAWRK